MSCEFGLRTVQPPPVLRGAVEGGRDCSVPICNIIRTRIYKGPPYKPSGRHLSKVVSPPWLETPIVTFHICNNLEVRGILVV